MPLAARAAVETSSPNPASARRNIFRRVANACLTTSSKSAAHAHRCERRGPRHQAQHRRGHRRRGMKRAWLHVEQGARLRVLRHRDRQTTVDAAPGRRGDPLGHLALDHHHRPRHGAGAAGVEQRQAPARWRSGTAGCPRPPAAAPPPALRGRRSRSARRRPAPARPAARPRARRPARAACRDRVRWPRCARGADRSPPAPRSARRARRRFRPPRRPRSRARPRRCAPARRGRAGSSAPRTSWR